MQRTTLGGSHVEVLRTMSRLASVMKHEGDMDNAAALYRTVLQERELAMGTRHPDTLDSAFGLAAVLYQLGQRSEAAALYRRVLEVVILVPSALASIPR